MNVVRNTWTDRRTRRVTVTVETVDPAGPDVFRLMEQLTAVVEAHIAETEASER